MKTVDNGALLASYVLEDSEGAFRELVERYIDLVYSTAVRLAGGNAQFAEDVAQTVFIDLARKARGLSSQVMLGGWLHRRTCNVAATMLRSERRRQARESEAMAMNTQQDHTQTNLARVAPILDEAINQLNAEDRAAIILRFFEQRDFRAVGEALHSSEDAARMRVSRALEKLHSHLNRRGVTLAAGALATGLAAEATTAAPAGLAGSIAGKALTTVVLGGGGSSALIELLTMTKLKVAIAGAVFLATIATLLLAQHQAQSKAALATLRQQNAALGEQLGQIPGWEAQEDVQPEADASVLDRLRQAQNELPRLRGEVNRLRQQVASAQSNQSVPTAVESNAPTNVISGFTRLQASVHSRLAPGQTLVMGGWPGHRGARVLLSVVPEIIGEKGDQVGLGFGAMELPERIVAALGLEGVRTESTSSGLSVVLTAEQDKALEETFWKGRDERGVPVPVPRDQADPASKHLHCFPNYVTAPTGQTTGLECFMASYGNGGYHGGYNWKYRGNIMVDLRHEGWPEAGLPAETRVFDLGPYSGPLFTVTPVVLSDAKSLDLTLQATVFWHLGDSP